MKRLWRLSEGCSLVWCFKPKTKLWHSESSFHCLPPEVFQQTAFRAVLGFARNALSCLTLLTPRTESPRRLRAPLWGLWSESFCQGRTGASHASFQPDSGTKLVTCRGNANIVKSWLPSTPFLEPFPQSRLPGLLIGWDGTLLPILDFQSNQWSGWQFWWYLIECQHSFDT